MGWAWHGLDDGKERKERQTENRIRRGKKWKMKRKEIRKKKKEKEKRRRRWGRKEDLDLESIIG